MDDTDVCPEREFDNRGIEEREGLGIAEIADTDDDDGWVVVGVAIDATGVLPTSLP